MFEISIFTRAKMLVNENRQPWWCRSAALIGLSKSERLRATGLVHSRLKKQQIREMSTVRLTRRLCDRVPMDERNTFAYRKKLQNQKRELRRREKRNKQKSEREAQLQLSAAQNAVVDAVSREAVVQSQNATQLIDLPVDFPVIEANGQQITGRSRSYTCRFRISCSRKQSVYKSLIYLGNRACSIHWW